MSELAACRMCLAVDARMYTIAGTPLQHVYERITDIPLQNGDKRPKKVCYLCCHLLRKNQAFMEKSVKADELLRRVLDRGFELTEAYIRLMDTSDVCSSLSVARPVFEDIFLQEQSTDVEPQEDACAQTRFKNEPPDFQEMEIEVEGIGINLNSDCPVNVKKEREIPIQRTKNNTLKEPNELKLSGNISNVKQGKNCSTNDDWENVKKDSTKPIQFKNNSLNEDTESNLTGIISNIKQEIECSINGNWSDNEKEERTIPIQRTEHNQLNEVSESNLIGIINNVKVERESNDADSLDTTPEIKQKNISTLNLHHCTHNSEVFESIPEHTVPNAALSTKCISTKPHQCSYCNKSFSDKRNLNRHTLIHSGEKPYGCSHCTRVFSHKSHLNTHMLIHAGEKPHQCTQCDKAFTQKSNLNQHILLHTGKKPHRCSYCDKTFTAKNHLNQHILMHTGEKPHRCTYCNKEFTQKSNLNQHILIHTGEKPHQCSYCFKTFSDKSNLNRHKLIHSAEKLHRCSYCNVEFAMKRHLNQHMLMHTKTDQYLCNNSHSHS